MAWGAPPLLAFAIGHLRSEELWRRSEAAGPLSITMRQWRDRCSGCKSGSAENARQLTLLVLPPWLTCWLSLQLLAQAIATRDVQELVRQGGVTIPDSPRQHDRADQRRQGHDCRFSLERGGKISIADQL